MYFHCQKQHNVINFITLLSSNEAWCEPATAGFVQASDGMCCWWVSKETCTVATWMSLASLSRTHLCLSVCLQARESSVPCRRMSLSHSVTFKLDSASLCPASLSFGPHMSFISICRNCETFTTTDCDRFHKLDFFFITVALGGKGKRQSSPSVDCEWHFHQRPFCHCEQSCDNVDF